MMMLSGLAIWLAVSIVFAVGWHLMIMRADAQKKRVLS